MTGVVARTMERALLPGLIAVGLGSGANPLVRAGFGDLSAPSGWRRPRKPGMADAFKSWGDLKAACPFLATAASKPACCCSAFAGVTGWG